MKVVHGYPPNLAAIKSALPVDERYAVYVEEMDRYHDVAGSEQHRFAEPEDQHSWLFYARDGDTVVAATRMTWGGDGFSSRQIDQYQLAPFLAEKGIALESV